MRKFYSLFILLATTAATALAQPADKILSKEELLKCPEKLGSIYYAYPIPSDAEVEKVSVPSGYTPFYISHYGRHGSRFQPNDARYKNVLDVFEAAYKEGNLTALGEDVMSRLHKLWIIARGNGGLLTEIGAQQHRDIARRMYRSFPQVFSQNKNIEARSSIVPRCKASMEAFCGSLLSIDNFLAISTDTREEFMSYIANDTPEQKALEQDTALWRGEWLRFEKENVRGERLLKTLFKDTSALDEYTVTIGLYWLAVGMQDVPTDLSLIELFLPEELYDIWRTINYRMYVANADAPIAKGIAIDAARPLLKNIIEKANEAIKTGEECATLRFGHDSHLIRLLSLIKIEGCGLQETDFSKLQDEWQDFYISPMAANLQMVFFKNRRGNILVLFLHNERPVALPIKSATNKFYRWHDVEKYFLTL